MRRILAAELSPYGRAGNEPRFALDGETVNLSPGQVLMLGMAVQELTTNAAKYGALSTQSGRVDVTGASTGTGPRRSREFDGLRVVDRP